MKLLRNLAALSAALLLAAACAAMYVYLGRGGARRFDAL